MDLFIIRGLPNSGKSTLAKILAPKANYSADDWFDIQAQREGLTYVQAFAKHRQYIGRAHDFCRTGTELALMTRQPLVAVANTFTKTSEMTEYLNLGRAHEYRTHVITIEKNHDNDNGHNVPDETVAKMAQRWQHLDKRFRC